MNKKNVLIMIIDLKVIMFGKYVLNSKNGQKNLSNIKVSCTLL